MKIMIVNGIFVEISCIFFIWPAIRITEKKIEMLVFYRAALV